MLFLLSPFILLLTAAALGLADLLFLIFGRKDLPAEEPACNHAASVVIPNWNGRDLLEKYLPSVVAAMEGHPDNEIIVVDNASEDGSAAYLPNTSPWCVSLLYRKTWASAAGRAPASQPRKTTSSCF